MRAASRSGTTLVELLIATVVTLLALAAMLVVAVPWVSGTHTLGEAADLQQRVRVAAVSLIRAIQHAGQAALVGPAAGRARAWPAVLPCTWATSNPGCRPVDDAVTLLGADDGLQVQLAEDMPGASSPLSVDPPAGCAGTVPACRFADGTRAVIFDRSGSRDEFVVTGVSADGAWLTHLPGQLSKPYPAGAVVARSLVETFYARPDPTSGRLQLRAARGDGDFPLLDGLVALRFEYFGDARPPDVVGVFDERVAVSYGPEPPPAEADEPQGDWPPGENCTFAVAGGHHVPRLALLPATEQGLSRLPLSLLSDGPWCPDAASPWRFDADLLRVRRVRLTLRFEAQSDAARGGDMRFFSRPGSARNPGDLVPDMEVVVDVALRNAR